MTHDASMSDDDLAAIKARRAAIDWIEMPWRVVTHRRLPVTAMVYDGRGAPIGYCERSAHASLWPFALATFVVDAPADIDALLAEVERAREENAHLWTALRHMDDQAKRLDLPRVPGRVYEIHVDAVNPP